MSIIQQTMMEQKAELESSVVGALSKMHTLLEKLVENTSKGDGSQGPPPVFPPPAPETPGRVGQGFMDAGTPLPGYASGVHGLGSTAGVASTAAGANAAPPPPMEKGTPGGVNVPNERELTSTFLCFCAESAGGVRNSGPSRSEVPCPRAGLYTRDRATGQLRVVSPTGYDRQQASRITATWAPKGLAILHDGSGGESVRRVY